MHKPLREFEAAVEGFLLNQNEASKILKKDEKIKTLLRDARKITKDLKEGRTQYSADETFAGVHDQQEDLPQGLLTVRKPQDYLKSLSESVIAWRNAIRQLLEKNGFDWVNTPTDLSKAVVIYRSIHMLLAAEASNKKGVWKIGKEHVEDLIETITYEGGKQVERDNTTLGVVQLRVS